MAQGSAPEVSAVLFVAEDNARTPLDTQVGGLGLRNMVVRGA
jgi:hypothetical protein